MTKISLDAVRSSSPFLGASIGVHAGLLALLFLSFGVAGGETTNPPARIEYDIAEGEDLHETEVPAEAPESHEHLEEFEPTDVPLELPIDVPEFDIPSSDTDPDVRRVLWQRDIRPIRRPRRVRPQDAGNLVAADAEQTAPPPPVQTAESAPSATPPSISAPVPAPVVFRPARKDPDHCRPPEYPEDARKNHWTGLVIVEVETDERGIPTDIVIITSSGRDVLDDAVLRAVRTWRFHPATRDGVPTVSRFRVPIRFGPSR